MVQGAVGWGLLLRWALVWVVVLGVAGRVPAVSITDIAGRGCGDGAPASRAAIGAAGLSWSTGELLIADARCVSIRRLRDGAMTRLAGSGVTGHADGDAATARLTTPSDVVRGGDGAIYWTEWQTRLVRRLTSDGVVETVAHLGVLSEPRGITATADAVYVADPVGSRIVEIRTPCTAPCVVLPFVTSGITQAYDVFAAADGWLYIADTWAHRIRRFKAGSFQLVAGTGAAGFEGDGGPAIAARLYAPSAVTVDAAGKVCIADGRNNRVRCIENGVISTVAGTGAIQSSVTGTITPDDVSGDPLRVPMAPNAIAFGEDGALYVSSATDGMLYAVTDGSVPTQSPQTGETILPASPHATYTPQPTYTARPTYTPEATHSPLPSRTPPATFTPRDTYTIAPTYTPQPTETVAPTLTNTIAVMATVTRTPTAAPTCPSCPRRCDVTGDGTVSSLDATRILQYVVGLNVCACAEPPCTPTVGGGS